jgi:hypothetical protein
MVIPIGIRMQKKRLKQTENELATNPSEILDIALLKDQ